MSIAIRHVPILFFLLVADFILAQDSIPNNTIVDIVWLKDGSKLSGTIQRWDLARGMELKLVTGAVVNIPKEEITRVYQDTQFKPNTESDPGLYVHRERPYAFREEGLYNTLSVFLDFSDNGGAGIHYSMGHKFNRMLGVGIGTGYESHDFNYTRNIVPLYAEARGYFLPQKITPYYALKMGYGFALTSPENGTLDAKGGFRFSPEMGVRFGGRAVSYYMGLEYILQNATFTNNDWWGSQGVFTDVISYRRVDLRMGLVF